ncbi:hypothetical protein BDN72DRAFT_900284 [Pluteus cervinus]|uniref:Uncharacterized protein n=1 Tax=Pluteus cervinus TaxID=181527 RepID=A0ACD3AK69_9AGAR|nr:hypothetical protein BDN72DRAFT_900284 [Pluteus cervinus]
MNPSMDPAALSLVVTWVETIVFGIYTALFFESTLITIKRSDARSASARVFTISTVIMYVIATIHIALALCRTIIGYVYTPIPAQHAYWFSKAPEHLAYFDLTNCMCWMGEFLLIYRCWIIWEKRFIVIIPSVLMFFSGIALGIFINIVWSVPGRILKYPGVVDAILPLFLAQNVWTTALLAYRLIRQHKQSEASGIRDTPTRTNLYQVGRIMLESAALFTLDLILSIVLHLVGSNIKVVFIELMVPIIGISFSLIAVRVHLSATHQPENPASFTIDWAVSDPVGELNTIGEVDTKGRMYEGLEGKAEVDHELGIIRDTKLRAMGMLQGSR